ncbi:MAG: glycoside hydrolase family 172 protein [Terriglobia bacterium]
MTRRVIYLLAAMLISPTMYGQDNNKGPLSSLPALREATSRRETSYDRKGGNNDFVVVKAKQTVTLLDVSGAGSVRHFWVTMHSQSKYHLREMVLRMYWDGELEPSVEVPIGDFFGSGFGMYHSWHSLPLTVQGKAMNCYFPMPFGSRARVTVTNEGSQDAEYFFYQIDYELYRDAAEIANQGRFHAQWRRENPTKAIPQEGDHPLHPSGDNNYVLVDAVGKGQFVGVILNVQGFSTGWWGEGDDMWFVDGESYPPSLHGTGLEDYFGNAWGFQDEFNYPFIGYSRKGNNDGTGYHTMYRFHIQDPIYFTKSLHGGIEHGHANSRADEFSSTAYWYQTEPHKKFDPLPQLDKRLPNAYWKIEVLEKELPN